MAMMKPFRAIAGFLVLLIIVFVPPRLRLVPDMFPASWRSIAIGIVWIGLLNTVLAYLISLLFSSKLPLSRSLATAWLALAGLTYIVPGVMELDPTSILVRGTLWDNLISPYFLHSLFAEILMHGNQLAPGQIASDAASSCSDCMDEHYRLAVIAIVLGAIAMIAAFLMAKSLKAGYWIWLGLLSLSLAGLAAYLVAARLGLGFQSIIVQVCWDVSYILAFVFAWRGTDLSKAGPLTSLEEWYRH
jgi:hypothetical protein